MAIPSSDERVLWGRAAGICSNPDCQEDLTAILASGAAYNIGEMAHVVSKSPKGPDGRRQGGSDLYDNLILLCPNCHSRVDKASKEYPEELLFKWKRSHEEQIRSSGLEKKFASSGDLKKEVSKLLRENRAVWTALGPKSETAKADPGSNLQEQWVFRKLDVILPNNRRISNMIEANSNLLSGEELDEFAKFKVHAQAFEAHQYDRLDNYPLFPAEFAERFSA